MSLAGEIKIEHRVVEVFDLAVTALVVDCALSFNDAAALLLGCAASQLTPGAVTEALKASGQK